MINRQCQTYATKKESIREGRLIFENPERMPRTLEKASLGPKKAPDRTPTLDTLDIRTKYILERFGRLTQDAQWNTDPRRAEVQSRMHFRPELHKQYVAQLAKLKQEREKFEKRYQELREQATANGQRFEEKIANGLGKYEEGLDVDTLKAKTHINILNQMKEVRSLISQGLPYEEAMQRLDNLVRRGDDLNIELSKQEKTLKFPGKDGIYLLEGKYRYFQITNLTKNGDWRLIKDELFDHTIARVSGNFTFSASNFERFPINDPIRQTTCYKKLLSLTQQLFPSWKGQEMHPFALDQIVDNSMRGMSRIERKKQMLEIYAQCRDIQREFSSVHNPKKNVFLKDTIYKGRLTPQATKENTFYIENMFSGTEYFVKYYKEILPKLAEEANRYAVKSTEKYSKNEVENIAGKSKKKRKKR